MPLPTGGPLGLVLLVPRTGLAETEIYQREVRPRRGRGCLRQLLRAHWRNLLTAPPFVTGTGTGTGTVGGTRTAVVPAPGGRLAARGTMMWVVATATATMMTLNVPLGLLADKIGAARLLGAAGVLFAVTGPVSYLTMTGTSASLLFTYGSEVAYLVCATTVLPKLLPDILPPAGPRPGRRPAQRRTRRHDDRRPHVRSGATARPPPSVTHCDPRSRAGPRRLERRLLTGRSRRHRRRTPSGPPPRFA
ncbi:hypothetical protein [Streptomyces sp. NPDC096152]|uniref:hypothetical protein n=1 Tax=Streptomyces sp. NPDC096152 TaxID=3366078 RepID=UPI0037F4C64E